MNYEVVVTCAVTGSGDTASRHPELPITPKQIADAAIDAAKAGAAVAHIHVRDPKTGAASRDAKLFVEVVDRVRSADTDVVINLTAGMGGDLVLEENAAGANMKMVAGTDLVGAEARLAHVKELRPEICSLDCGSLNFGDDFIYISTPPILRAMAKMVQEWGVKPELEVFELGHIRFANKMVAEGLIDSPPLFQICLGIPWGADNSVKAMAAMHNELPVKELPAGCNWGAFGIGRMQMPMAAVAVAMGGNVRVGLEDNLYLKKGVLASNAQLVERAVEIIERLGARAVTPAEARKKLSLREN